MMSPKEAMAMAASELALKGSSTDSGMGTHELRLVSGCLPSSQSWQDGPSCSWKRPHWLHVQQHASFA